MKPIKHFEEFIKNGVVKKQEPDISRAKHLIKESEKTYLFLKEIISKFHITNKNANVIIKLSYDIIMELIRAEMLQKGFNSTGKGAHEAEVSFLRLLNFKEQEIQFTNQLRYFRNGVMYYGKEMDAEYAKKVFKFLNNIYSQLRD